MVGFVSKDKEFILYYIICILLIFIYKGYRCKHPQKKDILEKELFYEIDFWSVSHLIFFAIVAYNFPTKKYIFISFILGCIWELFEKFGGSDIVDEHQPLQYIISCKSKLATEKNGNGRFWYAKWTDIIVNSLGLIIGYHLHKHLK